MADLMQNVDQRANLAGSNRMELLLFKLDGSNDLFGINVFKVREVLNTPEINRIPKSDDRVLGLISIRDQAMPLIDLPYALGRKGKHKIEKTLTIVTEYNKSIQAFLIHDVDRIIHKSWEDISPPPESLQSSNSLTAVTYHEDKIVQILDVESILLSISGNEGLTKDLEPSLVNVPSGAYVLCAEDSSVARKNLTKIFEAIGIPVKIFENGNLAWNYLKSNMDNPPVAIVSDLEMPSMDGYTLIKKIKSSKIKNVPVIVNSSMSGDFNKELIKKVGAEFFVEKWEGQELSKIVTQILT